MTPEEEKKLFIEKVWDSVGQESYKYKNPKTGKVFEYKRLGIYKDDDGTFLVRIYE